jgi:predicted nucleotidyltransferase
MPESNLPKAFLIALQALTEWLNDELVPYTTIGGVAVSLIAQPRITQDIDAVIWLEENRWADFVRSGEQYGFQPRIGDLLEFAKRARVILVRHEGSGINIDISCGALEFEREMIENSITLKIGTIDLKVPKAEDLIITKAVAQRPKDIIDIDSIIKVGQNLDLARIRHWTKEFADALEMPEIKESVESLFQHLQPSNKRSHYKKKKTGKRTKPEK